MDTATTRTLPTFDLGDRLRKAREHAGISSQAMADHLLVSRNTITRYEQRATRLTDAKLRRWAEVTGVPVAWLLTGDVVADQAGSGSTWVRTLSTPLAQLLTAA